MASFDELRDLSHFINKNRVKNIQVLGNPGQSNTLFKRFHEGLLRGDLNNDLEAMQALYGDSKNREGAYAKLKSRLHNRLQNTLFFIDLNLDGIKENPYNKALLKCYKGLIAVKILMGFHEKKIAIPIAERTLRIAQKYEFTSISLDLSKDLYYYYAVTVGDKKKYKKYKELLDKYEKLSSAETYSKKCYTEIHLHFAKSTSSKTELSSLVEKQAMQLRKILNASLSQRLIFHSFLVFSLKYELVNDYHGVLKTNLEGLSLLKSKKNRYISDNIKFNFKLRVAVSNLMVRNFNSAEKTLKECLKIVPKGSINWYYTLIYSIILHFHTTSYPKARLLYNTGINHSKIRQLPSRFKETWIILGAFLKYLESIGKLPIPEGTSVKPFRLSRFLNEVPVFSRDKRGTNITILILQVLFLLQQKNFGAIIDRTEALKMYSSRYLRRDDTFRSNCFIKMLLQLPRCQFNRNAVERHTQKYWKKLQSVPIEEARQSAEIEIMPYETLWEYVLESLTGNG